MLILTRKPGESLYIGDDVKITIVEIKGHQIRVGIDAPKEYRIYREEIYLAILEENRSAAAAPRDAGIEGLAGLPAGWVPGGKPKAQPLRGREVAAGAVKEKEVEMEAGEAPSAKDPQVVVRRKRPKKSDE